MKYPDEYKLADKLAVIHLGVIGVVGLDFYVRDETKIPEIYSSVRIFGERLCVEVFRGLGSYDHPDMKDVLRQPIKYGLIGPVVSVNIFSPIDQTLLKDLLNELINLGFQVYRLGSLDSYPQINELLPEL